jgi:nucleotide-binding universal stress UspA family protein
VVHVWHAAPSPHYDDPTRSGLKDAGIEALGAQVRAPAEGAGVGCEELVVFGRPQRTILDAAEELGADTVVLGAEGMSGLVHAPVGSVPEKVLRNANRTVLVVGGHPEGDPEGHAGPGT